MSLKSELLQFIEENLLEVDGEKLSVDDALIDRGLLDSIGLMQIMHFVEERANVRIPDGEVTPDNFQTVQAIDALVHRVKQGQK